MRVDTKQIIHLTNSNNASIRVVVAEDGLLKLLDADNQVTKDILPDGRYKSDGLTFQVKDGKQFTSQYSLKKGIPPRASRIPMQSTNQLMQQMAKEREAELSEWRKSGRI